MATSPFIYFPERIDSVEALEFLGFMPDAAQILQRRWTTHNARFGIPERDGSPDISELRRYIFVKTAELHLPSIRTLDSLSALLAIGITQELADAILDPAHGDIYGTETLEYWLNDSLMTNLYTLLTFQENAKGRVGQPANPESDTEVNDETDAESSQIPTYSVTINLRSDDPNFPRAFIAVRPEPENLPGHINLYKGGAWKTKKSSSRLFPNRDGSINTWSAFSGGPNGDFSNECMVTCLVDSPEIAEKYRTYTARRCPTAETWVIKLQVPESFLTSESEGERHWWGGFEGLMFYGSGMSRSWLLNDFAFRARTDFVVGHIPSTAEDLNMSQVITYDKLEERSNMHDFIKETSGQKGEQYCFLNRRITAELSGNVRGKMHIQIHRPHDGSP